MTVDELISTWTSFEREQFKDLIDECRGREIQISDARAESLKRIKMISDDFNGRVGEALWFQMSNRKSPFGKS